MIYIRVQIWNFDASPRCEYIELECRSEAHAVRTADRLKRLVAAGPAQFHLVGRRILAKRGIDGHIIAVWRVPSHD